MTRRMSIVSQNSSPFEDNEADNPKLKAQIKTTKKSPNTLSDHNTLHHWGLETSLNKQVATSQPQPTKVKKQEPKKKERQKDKAKRQGKKATSLSLIHTPEEITGRRP